MPSAKSRRRLNAGLPKEKHTCDDPTTRSRKKGRKIFVPRSRLPTPVLGQMPHEQEEHGELEGASEAVIPARDSVLATTDLLDLIFEELDPIQIVSLQRVCRQWRDAIAALPRIQRRLGFRPLAAPESSSSRPVERLRNPILEEVFYPVLDDYKMPQPTCSSRYLLGLWNLVRANMPIAQTEQMMGSGESRHRAFVRKGVSWRRMLVSQPPPLRVGYVKRMLEDPNDYMQISYGILDCPNGLTMGELWDIIYSIVTIVGENWTCDRSVWLAWAPWSTDLETELRFEESRIWHPKCTHTATVAALELVRKLITEDGVDLIIGEDIGGYSDHDATWKDFTRQECFAKAHSFKCEEYQGPPTRSMPLEP